MATRVISGHFDEIRPILADFRSEGHKMISQTVNITTKSYFDDDGNILKSDSSTYAIVFEYEEKSKV